MGERKVQAKYYPPDFDPSNLPRIKKKRDNDDAVRFMLPMSVRCETCGEFMGTGLKFNARKSHTGDDYLGIRIWRFTMKCKGCPATFSIRTDPKNSDYACETGVRRNYEPWRDAKRAQQEATDERTRQDKDAMQALENKTLDAKQQMDELDKLDEIKAANAKRGRINVDDVLATYEDITEQPEHNYVEEDGLLSKEDEDIIEKQSRIALQSRRENRVGYGVDVNTPKEAVNVKPEAGYKPSIVGGMFKSLKVKKKISKPHSQTSKSSVQNSVPSRPPAPSAVPAPTTHPASSTHPAPEPASLVAYDDVDSSSDGD